MPAVTVHAFLGLLAVGAGAGVDLTDAIDGLSHASIDGGSPPALVSATAYAVVVLQLPISEPEQTVAGYRSPSFWSDYYNRIHVVPTVLDVGNVVTTQVYPVEVWNGYEVPKQFVARSEEGTVGLDLAGVAPPAVWRSYESKFYTLTATPDVDFIVEALYTFTFLDANQGVLQVVGRGDVVVLPLSPDWAATVRHRLQYETNIMRAKGGPEQRVRLLDQPRQAWTMVLRALESRAVREWESILFRQQAGRFAVPVWTDGQRLPATLTAGSSVVSGIQTVGLDFADGGLAVLWRSATEFEPLTILSVGAGVLNLYSPTNDTWPAGTRLYPAQLARMPASQRVRRPAHYVAELQVTLDVIENLGLVAQDSATVYRGLRVMTTKPHEPEVPEDTWGRVVEVLDNGAAAPVVDDLTRYPDLVRPMRWLVGSRAEVKALRSWVHARAGRAVPFWLPTWREDLEQTQTLAAAGTQLTIRHVEFARFVAGNPIRRDLMIRHANGATFYRRVLSAAEINDGEEGLTLDGSLGVLANPGDLQISFLDLVRLDSDTVEIVWETDQVASVSVLCRTVEQ